MSPSAFQSLHETCRRGGYDFDLALLTAERDGVPWYVPAKPTRKRPEGAKP